MGELEDFVVCNIKQDPIKTTFNISQPYLITTMTQGFKEDAKSLMTLNSPATTHKDLLQPKISATLYFSGMYQKSFIYDRIRTNSQ